MTEDYNKDDVVINVQLPLKEYKIMREIIEERQAMSGLKKWVFGRIFWFAGGLLTILGVFEAFRQLGSHQ